MAQLTVQEQEIVRLLQTDDPRAMTLAYDHYAAALYGVALRVVQTEEAAQDVLQEVMVKIWRHRSRYDAGKGRLFTWMVNICRNAAVDALRSGRFSAGTQVRLTQLPVHTAEGLRSETYVDGIGLRDVMTRLDDKYRAVIELIYFDGYTHKEVEEALNIPLGTVKTRVKIGLRDLRLLLRGSSVMWLAVFTWIIERP